MLLFLLLHGDEFKCAARRSSDAGSEKHLHHCCVLFMYPSLTHRKIFEHPHHPFIATIMLKSLLAVVVPVLLAAFVAAQDLTINTPYVPSLCDAC